jgi:sporulation protein YlmC with PRC-barrel domain
LSPAYAIMEDSVKRTLSIAAATALGVGIANLAPAQQTPAPEPSDGAAPLASPQTGTAGELQDIGDMRVVGADGEGIGEVEDVLIDSTGRVVAVSVEAGGFLGMGDRDVIMQLDSLELRGDEFATTLTREEVEALPDWDDDD